jgi:hypothetical protein
MFRIFTRVKVHSGRLNNFKAGIKKFNVLFIWHRLTSFMHNFGYIIVIFSLNA